jgi:hypothetical protein
MGHIIKRNQATFIEKDLERITGSESRRERRKQERLNNKNKLNNIIKTNRHGIF